MPGGCRFYPSMGKRSIAGILFIPLALGCGESSADPVDSFVNVLGMGLATPPDKTPPTLTITSPAALTLVTDISPLKVTGTAFDDRRLAGVYVGETQAVLGSKGSWSATLALRPGTEWIAVTAVDQEQNATTIILTVTYTRPTVTFLHPTTGPTYRSALPSVTLQAEVRDDEPVTGVAWTNEATGEAGAAVDTGSDALWSATIALIEGSNRITWSVSDSQGHLTIASMDVLRSSADRFASWGLNSWGQLGNGTTVDLADPGAVGLAGVIAADGGSEHTVALLADGT